MSGNKTRHLLCTFNEEYDVHHVVNFDANVYHCRGGEVDPEEWDYLVNQVKEGKGAKLDCEPMDMYLPPMAKITRVFG